VAVVLAIRLPFLNQAVQGDDVYYLAGAEHAQIDPLHPNHVRYVFLGDLVDLRGHPHPPFDAWFLGLLLAIFRDVREVPFHAAYILFSLAAGVSMWALARRFSPHPLWATLLFLAVPAFVVNGTSLESDLPLLAFWMTAVALFAAGRLGWASTAMALAAISAYQAVFLTPILAVHVWLFRRRDARAWAATLVPPAALIGWQIFERLSTGALPASVLNGYFQTYGFQALQRKLESAAALTVHSCFLVFPALLPGAAVLAWRKRHERDTAFLLAWILIFMGGAYLVFFAGSARYLLPMAAPVALLVSRLRPKWLAAGFAAQLALSVGLAWVNAEHWDGYRQFAASLRDKTAGRHVWIDGEWGLRYYLEADGGLPLQRTQVLYPGDVVVSSRLAYPVEFHAPVAPIAQQAIRATLPLRLIGLDARSGYSTSSRGLRPFDISRGPIDIVRADLVLERRPTLSDLPMNAQAAGDQIVSGLYNLEGGSWRWMAHTAVILLKSPAAVRRLRAVFTIPSGSPARTVRLLVDGKEVAQRTFAGPGSYTLTSPPIEPRADSATVTIAADRSFSAANDRRELSIILSRAGFVE